jgi:thiamine biosynthesis lipoprotein
MKYDEFRAMNSDILLAASGAEADTLSQGFAMARQYINQSEQRFTRFTDTSELAELNRSAGSWFQVSPEMFEVLQKAYELTQATSGLFNPAVLPALKRAGYDRSMDEIRNDGGSVPAREEPDEKGTPVMDFRQVKLDAASRSVLLPVGMQIDLGGIAKGWIAEQAAHRLAEVAKTCGVNAGGDMFLINLPDGEPDWEVGLEDPFKPEQDLAVLHVKPGALATSSTAKRRWQKNGHAKHHLIDPRSSLPAETDWVSVTVWAEQATEAEVYAKALLIAGSKGAETLFQKHNSKAYLAVDKTGWVHGSDNFHEVFHV